MYVIYGSSMGFMKFFKTFLTEKRLRMNIRSVCVWSSSPTSFFLSSLRKTLTLQLKSLRGCLSFYTWDMKMRFTNGKFTHLKHIILFVWKQYGIFTPVNDVGVERESKKGSITGSKTSKLFYKQRFGPLIGFCKVRQIRKWD